MATSSTWINLQGISAKDLEENGSSWHRSCYKSVTRTGMVKTAKEGYERELPGSIESRPGNVTPKRSRLTRSLTSPLQKDACFFAMVNQGKGDAI